MGRKKAQIRRMETGDRKKKTVNKDENRTEERGLRTKGRGEKTE